MTTEPGAQHPIEDEAAAGAANEAHASSHDGEEELSEAVPAPAARVDANDEHPASEAASSGPAEDVERPIPSADEDAREGDDAANRPGPEVVSPPAGGAPPPLHSASTPESDQGQMTAGTKTDHVLTQVVPQLRTYAAALFRGSPGLGAAVDDYAGRVEAAARGSLPAAAAQAPDGLDPDAVARELTPARFASALELLRNVLIFAPILWTWIEIGRATAAYSRLLDRSVDAPEARSFLHLWQQGFDGAGGAFTFTLTETAWVAAGLILALIGVHVAATLARSANTRARDRRAADFGALLARASAVHRPTAPETPEEQLDEFARAGLSLATQLADLSITFGQRTAPLAESLAAAERAMAEMSSLVRQQSSQMAEVTKSLTEVAAISRRLETVADSMTRSSSALEQMQDRLGPATEELVATIREFRTTAEAVERATDNFTESLADSQPLRESAVGLNAIANRFLDTLDRQR